VAVLPSEEGEDEYGDDFLVGVMDFDGLADFGIVNVRGTRCHLIAVLSSLLPIRAVRDAVASEAGTLRVARSLGALMGQRSGAVFSRDLEAALFVRGPGALGPCESDRHWAAAVVLV
jgi:hypothetical protein